MSHQPYELLLFKEQPLLPQELEQLNQHLATCESCRSLSRAWKTVERHLDHPVIIAPAEGFAARWRQRLEAERKLTHTRQNMVFLGLSTIAIVFLSLGILVVVFPLLQSPNLLFWTYVERLLSFALVIDILKDLTISFYITIGQQFSGNPAWIALLPLGIIFVIGLVFEVIVLWYISLRWITRPRRVTL
jgi:hypothetical protein